MNNKTIFTVEEDGFHGELFQAKNNTLAGKALVLFSGSDGRFRLACMMTEFLCRN